MESAGSDIDSYSADYSKEHEIPEFIVRCLKKIEPMISAEGIYRINGDIEKVEAMRYEHNN